MGAGGGVRPEARASHRRGVATDAVVHSSGQRVQPARSSFDFTVTASGDTPERWRTWASCSQGTSSPRCRGGQIACQQSPTACIRTSAYGSERMRTVVVLRTSDISSCIIMRPRGPGAARHRGSFSTVTVRPSTSWVTVTFTGRSISPCVIAFAAASWVASVIGSRQCSGTPSLSNQVASA